jgi:hypothetical protein
VLVLPAYPSKGLVKSIVITKKIARRSLFMFTSSLGVVLEFTLDLNKLDACPSQKVYKKMVSAEMVLAQLNACPMKYGVNFIGARAVFLGRILFHRGCPATPLKVGFNRGEAQKGQVEVVLPDGTRCDCVTDTHAIEFDFGVPKFCTSWRLPYARRRTLIL